MATESKRAMQCWSFYRLANGTFTSRRIVTSNHRTVEKNTPDGCAAIAGRYDRQTQRVDLETGEVIAYEAPRDARRERDQAEARITALEVKQLRPLRELFLNPGSTEARQRLSQIEAEIASLRKGLS